MLQGGPPDTAEHCYLHYRGGNFSCKGQGSMERNGAEADSVLV